jgi:hypothetical protein
MMLLPPVGVLQFWLLAVIGITSVAVFVAVAILTIINLLGWIRLPKDIADKLNAVLVIEIAIVSVAAFGWLLAPNALERLVSVAQRTALESVAEVSPAGATGEPTQPTEVASVPQEPSSQLPELNLACSTPERLPLVYIQIGSENARSTANDLQAAAQKANLIAPGVELRSDYTEKVTQVRYFHEDERADASAILELARQFVGNAPLQLLKFPIEARKCQFEVWIGELAPRA